MTPSSRSVYLLVSSALVSTVLGAADPDSNFNAAFERCGDRVSALAKLDFSKMPAWTRPYYRMCEDPTKFLDCLHKEMGKTSIPDHAKRVGLIFCNEYLPDSKKLKAKTTSCTLETSAAFVNCNKKSKKMTMYRTEFLFKSPADHDATCDQFVEVAKCLQTEYKECGEEAVDFTLFYSAMLGGECLAKKQFHNPIVTVEQCASGGGVAVSASSVTAALVMAAAAVLVADR